MVSQKSHRVGMASVISCYSACDGMSTKPCFLQLSRQADEAVDPAGGMDFGHVVHWCENISHPITRRHLASG